MAAPTTVYPADPVAMPQAAGPAPPPPEPASYTQAPIVDSPHPAAPAAAVTGGSSGTSGQPAVQAAKDGAANVGAQDVARDLGLQVRTAEQHEAIKEAEQTPTRPQDQPTGGLVKQHDVGDIEAADPDTFNVWGDPHEIPKELVRGIENDELFKVIRRFDKQMYHVKAAKSNSGELQKRGLRPELEMDLVNSSDEEFSPDRLRSNIERLYITFVVGSAAFFKHIQRLRSWGEFNRTASWCAVYFTAWFFAQVGLFLTGTIVLLMVYPPARDYLFPPAPLALVSAKSGGLQKPPAGDTIGSKDSLTGAAEAHKGEAVENEASNFVNGIASVAMASAIGKQPETDTDQTKTQTKVDKIIPDPTTLTTKAAEGQDKAGGAMPTSAHNKAKDPVIDSIWKSMRPVMRGLEDFCDNYERFCNALSPVTPYPQHMHRLRLAAVVLPIGLLTAVIKVEYMSRAATFGMGLAFFSQPYMSKGIEWFLKTYPDWMDMLQLQNTLLKGVPSNAQLALTLLRIGEEHNTPLPPPPQYTGEPPERPVTPELIDNLPPVNEDTAEEDLSHDHEFNGSDTTDVDDAVLQEAPGQSTGHHKGKRHRFLGFLKGTARAGVSATLGADRVKASAGSSKSKQRQGVLKRRQYVDGPSMFKCRYGGKKGWLFISTSATTPCISFVRENQLPGTDKFDPKFSLQIEDILEMKKLGGLGWKSKLLVGSVLGMEVIDALTLVTAQGDTVLTALPRRDELFNRLIALSQNRWDSF